MDKSKKIKIIIAMLVIIILIIAIIIFLLNKIDQSQEATPPYISSEETETKKVIREVYSSNDYFTVKNSIEDYYKYCKKLNTKLTDINPFNQVMSEEELRKYREEKLKKLQETTQEQIYNILDNSYIEEFNITKENIISKFGIQNQFEIVINRMYVLQNSLNVNTYFVTGTFLNVENSQIKEFNIAVSLDMLNNTYSIYPDEYLQKHGYINIKVGDKIDINIESIDNKDYNTFEYKFVEDNEIAREYFNNYKYTMLYNTEKAYYLLDEEYREKRFGSLEEYKKFVNENYSLLGNSIVTKYQTEESGTNKEYICLDNYDNYYIFKENSINNFSVLLDTYTIEQEKFTEAYNKGSISTKVQMNIDKFIQMINAKDYKSSYALLYDGFKNNYFQTEEAYKQYIKSNFFEYNKVEYDKFSNEGETYIYELTLFDKTESTTDTKKLTIIMKLNDGTNFIMSFSIE